jgi:hypothetical protein
MPRLVYLTGLALLLLCGAFLLTDRLLHLPGITEANVKRIRRGMTLTAVERLLGGPATPERSLRNAPPNFRPCPLLSWEGPTGRAHVYFTLSGNAVSAVFEPPPAPDSLDQPLSEGQP